MLDTVPYSTSADNQSISDEVISNSPMASPSMRQDWNEKLAVYLRLNAVLKANITFGPMALIAAAAEQEDRKLEERFGPDFRQISKVKARFAERLQQHQVIDDELTTKYIRPLTKAAEDLVLTPAPDLPAAIFKVDLIERDDLEIFAKFEGDLFQIVLGDMERVASTGCD